jgi:hypothetical protein
MKEELILLHELSIARLLKTFAVELGVSESFADILAQVHVSKSPILGSWSQFFQSNCIDCRHETSSCGFFHPTKESCRSGATPHQVRQSNIAMVEVGRITACPLIARQE